MTCCKQFGADCCCTCLNEPDGAVPRDYPVRNEPDQRKVHLAEEEEQGENAHDVHVHASDLHDPQACGVGVLYFSGLVVLKM